MQIKFTSKVLWLCILVIVAWQNSFQAQDLNSLRSRQAKVQEVVAKNMGAVVAVTDGIGFGSGVIVSEDGLVLTAAHVMANGGDNYRIVFPGGKEVKAKPLGKNLNMDAGMVRIAEPGKYPFVELGKYKKLKLGDWCVCLGHPGGYELGRTPPVRVGKVLELNKNDLVTDCALIGGDSGGPLFDLDGKLIGIHSSIGNNIAINRHVSVDTYKQCWDKLVAGKQWGNLPSLNSNPDTDKSEKRAGLGVSIEPSQTQAKITRVRSGSPAERVGMKVGDIITAFDGKQITSSTALIDLIKQKKPGDSAKVTTVRNSTVLNYQVILSDLITK